MITVEFVFADSLTAASVVESPARGSFETVFCYLLVLFPLASLAFGDLGAL